MWIRQYYLHPCFNLVCTCLKHSNHTNQRHHNKGMNEFNLTSSIASSTLTSHHHHTITIQFPTNALKCICTHIYHHAISNKTQVLYTRVLLLYIHKWWFVDYYHRHGYFLIAALHSLYHNLLSWILCKSMQTFGFYWTSMYTKCYYFYHST